MVVVVAALVVVVVVVVVVVSSMYLGWAAFGQGQMGGTSSLKGERVARSSKAAAGSR